MKLRERYRDIPYTHQPNTCTVSPIMNILYQSGMFVKFGEPTLTHHSHPKPVVIIRSHSWCCAFFGLEQMYNDMCLPL